MMGPVVFMGVLAPWAASAEHSVHREKRGGRQRPSGPDVEGWAGA